nr:hypothetical protein [Neobacillus sp. Marseille-Q6967]
MKEFTICYTFDNEIITEKAMKESDVTKADVEQEVLEKLDRQKYFLVKNEQGSFMINSYLVRYVRIMHEKILV